MGLNPKPRRRPNYPLWIIAICLMVIAICLVIDVVQKRRDAALASKSSPRETAPKELPATNSRPQFKVRSSRSATDGSARALTDTDATPVSDEVRGEVSSPPLTPPTAAIRDSGTGAGGGFAPIAISPDVRAAGEVAGRVRLLGKPPVETRINLNADPASARLHPTPLFTRNFVVSTNGGLANAVVAVANVKSRPAVPTNAVVVQFTNCLVEPYVVAATPGQRLRFENAMPLDHVVRVTSYAGDPGFTFTLKAGRSSHSIITSTNEGPLSIACTIHPWETARVWSLNYAAVTDKNGDFRIQGIPPGEYLVGSSHGPSTNFNFRPAIVSPGQLAAVNFSIDAPKR